MFIVTVNMHKVHSSTNYRHLISTTQIAYWCNKQMFGNITDMQLK